MQAQEDLAVDWRKTFYTDEMVCCVSNMADISDKKLLSIWIVTIVNKDLKFYLFSTFNLTLLICWLNMGGQTWLGAQVVTLKFNNNRTLIPVLLYLLSAPAIRWQVPSRMFQAGVLVYCRLKRMGPSHSGIISLLPPFFLLLSCLLSFSLFFLLSPVTSALCL